MLLEGRSTPELVRSLEEASFELGEGGDGARGWDVALVHEPIEPLRADWNRVRVALGRRARCVLVARPEVALSSLPAMSASGLEPKELLLVHAHASAAPHAAIVVATMAKPGGLRVHALTADLVPARWSAQQPSSLC